MPPYFLAIFTRHIPAMRKVFLSIVLLYSTTAFAQTTDTKAVLKTAAQHMGSALVNKEYATFVKSTYPKVLANMQGGLEKMATDLKLQVEGMEKNNNKIIAAWPGEPTAIIDTAGEWQATIPQKMTMELDNGNLTTETTLIAISPDKGKTWYFVDAADRDINAVRTMFPNFSSKLVLEKSPEPVFEIKK